MNFKTFYIGMLNSISRKTAAHNKLHNNALEKTQQ